MDGSKKFISPGHRKEPATSTSIFFLLQDEKKWIGLKTPSHIFFSKSCITSAVEASPELGSVASPGPSPSSCPIAPRSSTRESSPLGESAHKAWHYLQAEQWKEANWLVKSLITTGTCLIWACWCCLVSPQYLCQPGWLTAQPLIMQLVAGNRNLAKAQPFTEENNLPDT